MATKRRKKPIEDLRCAITVKDLEKLLARRRKKKGCAVLAPDLEKHLKRRKKKR